ncbi:capsid protein [Crucivirus-483]|nr:capsid protein [Crucivirus-483]
MGTPKPTFLPGSNGNVRLVHREYIGDVQPSALFRVASYGINPGLTGTFPWLAQISDAFEQYRFNGLVFEFKSLASQFFSGAATQSMGSLIMATDYNANNPSFGSKREMENYEFCTSAPPTKSFVHAVEVSRSQNPLNVNYIRTGAPTDADFDLRMYDIGKFEVATNGNQVPALGTANTIGELWVTYDVELIKPKFRLSGTRIDHYMLNRTGTADGNYGLAASNLYNYLCSQPLIDAHTPGPNALTARNGLFAIGTHLTYEDGVGSRLHFPSSSSSKSYQITVMVSANVSLSTDPMPVFTLTYLNCDGHPFSFFSPLHSPLFLCPGPGVTTTSTRHCLSMVVTVGNIDNGEDAYVNFVTNYPFSSVTGLVASSYDIIVTEVNLGGSFPSSVNS